VILACPRDILFLLANVDLVPIGAQIDYRKYIARLTLTSGISNLPKYYGFTNFLTYDVLQIFRIL